MTLSWLTPSYAKIKQSTVAMCWGARTVLNEKNLHVPFRSISMFQISSRAALRIAAIRKPIRGCFSALFAVLLVSITAVASATANPLSQAESVRAPTQGSVKSLFTYESGEHRANGNSQKRTPREDEFSARQLPSGGRLGHISIGDLETANVGDRFDFVAAGREAFLFTTERVVRSKLGVITWVGVNADASLPRRAYVSFQNGVVTGSIETADSQFELFAADSPPNEALSSDNETVANAETKLRTARAYIVDFAEIGASRAISVAPDYAIPPPLNQRSPEEQQRIAERRVLAERESLQPFQPLQKAAPTPASTIDVMIAFTDGMVTRHGSVAAVNTRLATLVQYANTAYVNSEVAITLNLVHTVQVSYPNTGDNETAMYSITGRDLSGTYPIPSSLSSIAGLRNTHGADIVVLVRPFSDSTHSGCGIAWIGGFNVTNIADDDAYGYAVVSDGSSVDGGGFFCSMAAFPHELGHNMGLMHERAITGGQVGATAYAYGYIASSSSVGDIMSYANQQGQAFSSPAVRCSGTNCSTSVSGTALGVAANTPVESCISSSSGCNASQASSCSTNPSTCADAARALNFTRVKVSQWRSAASTPPSISGTATLSSGGNVFEGTQLCINGTPSGASCTTTASGNYSCNVPSGWTGTLHLQAGNNSRVAAKRFTTGITSAQSGQNFVVSSATAFACNLDIDNDGLYTANIDGVMILRKLLGVTGMSQLTTPAPVTACAQRTNQTDMLNYLNGRSYNFDAGSLSAAREGLVLLRLMLGMSGTQAVAGTGYTWSSIQSSLNSACGTSF